MEERKWGACFGVVGLRDRQLVSRMSQTDGTKPNQISSNTPFASPQYGSSDPQPCLAWDFLLRVSQWEREGERERERERVCESARQTERERERVCKECVKGVGMLVKREDQSKF